MIGAARGVIVDEPLDRDRPKLPPAAGRPVEQDVAGELAQLARNQGVSGTPKPFFPL